MSSDKNGGGNKKRHPLTPTCLLTYRKLVGPKLDIAAQISKSGLDSSLDLVRSQELFGQEQGKHGLWAIQAGFAVRIRVFENKRLDDIKTRTASFRVFVLIWQKTNVAEKHCG
jgi:hypothetical protein